MLFLTPTNILHWLGITQTMQMLQWSSFKTRSISWDLDRKHRVKSAKLINEPLYTTLIRKGKTQEIPIISMQLEGRVTNVTSLCKTCGMEPLKCANLKKVKRNLSKRQRVPKVVLASQFSHAATNQAMSVLNRELKANKRTARKLHIKSD